MKLTQLVSRLFLTLCLSSLVGFSMSYAQDTSAVDTTATPMDSTKADSGRLKASIPISRDALEEEVQCAAKDSIVYDIGNKRILLYGEAVVDYGELHLEAERVVYNYGENLMRAHGIKDSSGNEINYPKVVDKGKEFRGDSMVYNVSSKKGKIYNLKMQEGNGYVHVDQAKKMEDDIMFAKDAKYTTCDADEPHFWMHMNKAKIIPNDKVVTGPAYLKIEDVPLPAIIPFGFFPTNVSKASSGIVFPRYGFTPLKGYNLTDGGYYFAISDKFDLSVTGDIFSFGYWGVNVKPRYKVRYKYSGSAEFNLDKNPSNVEIKGVNQPIYDFRVTWQHRQDPKSIPGMTFSANVNAGTATYAQNSAFSTETRLNRNLLSSINFSKKLGNNFNFSSSLNHNQNLTTRSISFSLPTANLSMQRQTPFENIRNDKLEIIKNLNFSHSINFNNRINTFDSLLFDPEHQNQWNTGIKHNLPIKTSFKLFKHFNFNPSFTYNGYVNFYENQKVLDTANTFQDDRAGGLFYAYDYQFNTQVNTRLYGTVNFAKSKNLVALRHMLTPTLRLNYTPDFTQDKYGYYRTAQRTLEDSTVETTTYNRFGLNPVGAPQMGKNGSMGFDLQNRFELKVRDRKDTTKENATKKITLLESVNANMDYNFFADSINFSDLSLSARTRLFDGIVVRSDARLTPYAQNENFQKTGEFLWEQSNGEQLMRLEYFKFNASVNITEKMFKGATQKATPAGMFAPGPDERYPDHGIPISMNIGYDYTLRNNQGKLDATQSVRVNGNINLTEKWGVNYDMNYDLETMSLGYSKFAIRRDLHCWEFSFDWTPAGPSQGFYFTLRAKAAELESLKLEKNEFFWD